MAIFLITDIEGSTEKWEKHKKEMGEVLSRHDDILSNQIEKHNGKIIKHTGDGIFAVFEDGQPLQCAIEIQKVLAAEEAATFDAEDSCGCPKWLEMREAAM